ncbi:MAG: peptidyl-prolyl cis-trans isomerase [Candidatus Eiseniibacteriota bacterium]
MPGAASLAICLLLALMCVASLLLAATSSTSAPSSKSSTGSKTATKTGTKKSASATGSSAAKGTASGDTSRVLVRVGKEPITRAMVEARLAELPDQYKAQYSTPTGRQQLLDRMVEEKVWLDVALKNGVAARPKVKQQLEQQRNDLLIRTWISEQMAANPAPSDSEAMTYYQQHESDYKSPATVTLRHIQFATEPEAKRVLPFARDPKKDFGDLAKKYSSDTLTAKNGGQLGTATRDGVFPTLGTQKLLADSAFTLAEGQIGGPWKTDRGWHIVRVDQKHDESTRPFDQVKPLIVRQLNARRTQDYYRDMLDKAKHDVGVHADSTAIKGFVSQQRSARELFQDAQQATDPRARIAGYQRVVDDWPNSDVAPQSQFMIGFISSEELKDYQAAERAMHAVVKNYPKSDLVPSAQWMIEHMRTDDIPDFISHEADSARSASAGGAGSATTPTPKTSKTTKP